VQGHGLFMDFDLGFLEPAGDQRGHQGLRVTEFDFGTRRNGTYRRFSGYSGCHVPHDPF
jgi:hypothetical protein